MKRILLLILTVSLLTTGCVVKKKIPIPFPDDSGSGGSGGGGGAVGTAAVQTVPPPSGGKVTVTFTEPIDITPGATVTLPTKNPDGTAGPTLTCVESSTDPKALECTEPTPGSLGTASYTSPNDIVVAGGSIVKEGTKTPANTALPIPNISLSGPTGTVYNEDYHYSNTPTPIRNATGLLTYTLTVGAHGNVVLLPFPTITGTATQGADYVYTAPTSSTAGVTFPTIEGTQYISLAPSSADQTATVTFEIKQDSSNEDTSNTNPGPEGEAETIILTFSTGTSYSIPLASVTVKITDDDAIGGAVISNVTVNDDGTNITTIVVTFDKPVTTTGTVQLALNGGGTATCTATSSVTMTCTPDATTPKANSYVNVNSLTGGTILTDGNNIAVDRTLPVPAFSLATTSSTIQENAGLVTYTVTIPDHKNTVTLNWTAAGTANNATDLTAALTNGTLTFAPGETTKTITFTVTDDTVDEGDNATVFETVALTFTPVNSSITGSAATYTYNVQDNDAAPSITFNTTTLNVLESTGAQEITLTFSNPTIYDPATFLTVNPTYNTAAAGDGTFTIVGIDANNDGIYEGAKIVYTPANDAVYEGGEELTFTLASTDTSKGTVGTTGSTTVAIGDSADNSADKPTATLAGGPTQINENNTDNTITYNFGAGQYVSVAAFNAAVPTIACSGGSALITTDYTCGTATAITAIVSGETVVTGFTFIAQGKTDTVYEGNETFNYTISSTILPANIGPTTVTVVESSSQPTLSFDGGATITKSETEGTHTIKVKFDNINVTSATNIIIPYTIAISSPASVTTLGTTNNGTNDAWVTSLTGNLTIPTTQTEASLTFNIFNDTIDENNEVFTVTLGTPTGASVTTGQTVQTITITDNDDMPTITASVVGNIGVTEPATAGQAGAATTYDLTLSGGGTTKPWVFPALTGGDADYAYTITCYNGSTPLASCTNDNELKTKATVSVTATGDKVFESLENKTLSLTSTIGGTNAPIDAKTIAITDFGTKPTIAMKTDTLSVTEGDANKQLVQYDFSDGWTVDLSGTPLTDFINNITVTKTPGTATAPDYTFSAITMVGTGPYTGFKFDVTGATDNSDENSPESMTYLISSTSSITVTGTASTVNIVDADPDPTMSWDGGAPATIDITENATSGQPGTAITARINLSVSTVKDISGLTPNYGGGDSDYIVTKTCYTGAGAVVTGCNGANGAISYIVISATATGDTIFENAEPFTLSLSGGGLSGTITKTVNITDATGAVNLTYATTGTSVTEGSTQPVTLNFNGKSFASGITPPITVSVIDVSTINGTDMTSSADNTAYSIAWTTDGSGNTTGGTLTFKGVTDTFNEVDETFTFKLTSSDVAQATINGNGNTIGPDSTVTVVDATASPSISIGAGTYSANEGGTDLTIPVNLGGTTNAQAISFTLTLGGTGTIGGANDYTAVWRCAGAGDVNLVSGANTVTIAATNTTGCNVVLTPKSDLVIDDGETVTLAISDLTATTAQAGGTVATTVTIADKTPVVTPGGGAAVTKVEGTDNTYSFTVSTNNTSSSPITVDYVITAVSGATQGTDYTATYTGTLTIPANQSTSNAVDITIVNDTISETNETFKVTLNNISGALLTSGAVSTFDQVVTIQDNDTLGITSATTLDRDGDGKIDGYKVVLTYAVTDSQFPGYALNGTGTATANWLVNGFSNVKLLHGTAVTGFIDPTTGLSVVDTANDNTIYLVFDENASTCNATTQTGCDTGSKPDLTTTATPGLPFPSAVSTADVTEADGAKPVAVKSSGTGGGTAVTVIFSEPVGDTTSTGTCATTGIVETGDVTANNGLTFSGLTDACGNDNTIVLTSSALTGGASYTLTFPTGVATPIKDVAGNTVNGTISLTVADTTPPTLLSVVAVDGTNDKLTFTFNEAILGTDVTSITNCTQFLTKLTAPTTLPACTVAWSVGNTVAELQFTGDQSAAILDGTIFTTVGTDVANTSGTNGFHDATGNSDVSSVVMTGSLITDVVQPYVLFATDITPPSNYAGSTGVSTILVKFSETMKTGTLTNISASWFDSYTLSGGVSLAGATVSTTDNQTFTITLASRLTSGTEYTLTAASVQDRAPVPNSITDPNSTTFKANDDFKILSATATGTNTLSVNFSKLVDSSAACSSGCAQKYYIGPSSEGLTVTNAVVTDTTVTLTLSGAMRGISYTLVGANGTQDDPTSASTGAGGFDEIANDAIKISGTTTNLSGNPFDRISFQGSGTLVNDMSDGWYMDDPFGDGSIFSFTFNYKNKVFVGPNSRNNTTLKFDVDGKNVVNNNYGFTDFSANTSGVASCTASTGFGMGYADNSSQTCVNYPASNYTGRYAEQGIVGYTSLTTNSAEYLVVGAIGYNIKNAYFTQNNTNKLTFKPFEVPGYSGGGNVKSLPMFYSDGNSLYMGVACDLRSQCPSVLKAVPAVSSGTITSIPAASPSFAMSIANGDHISGYFANVNDISNTTDPIGIDSMLTFEGRMYIANSGGILRTATLLTAAAAGDVNDKTNISPANFLSTGNSTLVMPGQRAAGTYPEGLLKVSPGQKGIPFMKVHNGKLYVVRNVSGKANGVAVSTDGITEANKTPNDAEIWACTLEGTTPNRYCNSNWTKIITASTDFNSNAKAISMFEITPEGVVYLGFDDDSASGTSAVGFQVWRKYVGTSTDITSGSWIQQGPSTNGQTKWGLGTCDNKKSNGDATTEVCYTHIQSSTVVKEKPNDAADHVYYLYITVGKYDQTNLWSQPIKVYRQSDNGQNVVVFNEIKHPAEEKSNYLMASLFHSKVQGMGANSLIFMIMAAWSYLIYKIVKRK